MKIRCSTNSIRLRLRKSDIAILEKNGKVEDSLDFPGGKLLSYALLKKDIKDVEANFEDGYIYLSIPIESADKWINSNQIGIETTIELAAGKALHVLIEKDFPCKDGEEDFSDTFYELNESDNIC